MTPRKRNRSNTKDPRSSPEPKRAKLEVEGAAIVATPENPVSVVEEEVATVTTVNEYVEDVIDYDDDDLGPVANDKSVDPILEVEDLLNLDEEISKVEEKAPFVDATKRVDKNETETTTEIKGDVASDAQQLLAQAKGGLVWSVNMLLTQVPHMPQSLHLNTVGDHSEVEVPFNGQIIEVSWKIAGTYDQTKTDGAGNIEAAANSQTGATATNAESAEVAPAELDQTANNGETHPATSADDTAVIRCKFGKFCAKGKDCPYDHTIKKKLCVWVNSLQGCAQGDACVFSHEIAGVTCTRNTTRTMCQNGRSCAYRHQDDQAWTPAGLKNATSNNAPTRPSNGQKRGRGEDRNGAHLGKHAITRGGSHGRDRGRGRGRGRGGHGRGRGASSGGRGRGRAQ
jgi:hypothetical protein